MKKMSSKDIEKMPEPVIQEKNNDDFLKFAIKTHENISVDGGQKAELVAHHPDEPLKRIVNQYCSTWMLQDPDKYHLRYSEKPYHFVPESAKKEIRGKILHLDYSPDHVTKEFVKKLDSGNNDSIKDALAKIADRTSDPMFDDAFVANNGLRSLEQLFIANKIVNVDSISNGLSAFLETMSLSNKVQWSDVNTTFIDKMIFYVENDILKGDKEKYMASVLLILECFISSTSCISTYKKMSFERLVDLLKSKDQKIQQNALGVINAILTKSDVATKENKIFLLRTDARSILQNVVDKQTSNKSAEICHQLYTLQALMLNTLDEQRNCAPNINDPDVHAKVNNLCFRAFYSDTGASLSSLSVGKKTIDFEDKSSKCSAKDFKRLGFENDSDPLQDFCRHPPGVLALDALHYLANAHPEAYTKIVIECACKPSGTGCPLAKACIALVEILRDYFKMGEPPEDRLNTFHPFFFTHNDPFFEIFCVCVQLMLKTWKEMRASSEDFEKVIDVVKEQVTRSLDNFPIDIPAFQTDLNKFRYSEIQRIRQEERSNREESELQAKPIQELRKQLIPEMTELVKRNRINYMTCGTKFQKFAKNTIQRLKEKYEFLMLSPNGKTLHYKDCNESRTPTVDEMKTFINVSDITKLLVGKECSQSKEKSKKANSLAFSIIVPQGSEMGKETEKRLDFIAPDERVFDLWTDGIHALIGEPMVSKQAEKDLEMLLNMEIKIRLLHLEGMPEIPQEPPLIPDLPPSIEFMGDMKF